MILFSDIPNLTESNINYGDNAFLHVAKIDAKGNISFLLYYLLDAPDLEKAIRKMSKWWVR